MKTKKCNKCLKEKSLSDFFNDKSNKTDGRYPICKKCKTAATMKWRGENREHYNEVHRVYCADNYQKLRLQRYKMTPEEHAKILLDQKGVCAICEQLQKGERPLVVDHCHTKGNYRGLLCYGCNRALHVLESEDLLRRAMAYLKKHS